MPPLILSAVLTKDVIAAVENPPCHPSLATRVAKRVGLPIGIQRLFGIEDKCSPIQQSAVPSPSAQQRDAYSFYDNLAGASPDKEIKFRQYELDSQGRQTGASRERTITVAGLINLSGTWREDYARLGSILDRNSDLFTTVRPSDAERDQLLVRDFVRVTGQTRDPSFADPTGILRAPWRAGTGQIPDPYHPSDPRSVAAWYPNVANIPTVYPTARMLNRADVPTQRLRNLYYDLHRALHAHLKARNVPAVFHPLMVACQAHIFPSYQNYSNLADEKGSRVTREWAENNGDLSYLAQNTILGFSYPTGDQSPGPTFSNHWLWEASLDRRVPCTIGTDNTQTRGVWDDGDRKTTYNLYTADACLELVRLLNAAYALRLTGDAAVDARAVTVELYAANQLYHGAQVEAYRQVGKPFGSAVLGYRDAIDREAQARKARARGSLGVPGYESSGDDTEDIAMGLVGCVGTALGAAVATGNVFVGIAALVISGANLLYTFLSGPDAPRNPYDYPIRMLGGKSCDIPGVSVKNALELCPVYRVR